MKNTNIKKETKKMISVPLTILALMSTLESSHASWHDDNNNNNEEVDTKHLKIPSPFDLSTTEKEVAEIRNPLTPKRTLCISPPIPSKF